MVYLNVGFFSSRSVLSGYIIERYNNLISQLDIYIITSVIQITRYITKRTAVF